MKRQFQALGRLKSGTMNKTEANYSRQLEALKMAGAVLWYKFEPCSLKLAANTHYRPDFMVMRGNGELEFHEVKGFWTDDAKAKTKIAAEMFPIIRFLVVKAKRGGWEVEEI